MPRRTHAAHRPPRPMRPLEAWLPPTDPSDTAVNGLPLAHLYRNLTWQAYSVVIGLENEAHFEQWVGGAGPPAEAPRQGGVRHVAVLRALMADAWREGLMACLKGERPRGAAAAPLRDCLLWPARKRRSVQVVSFVAHHFLLSAILPLGSTLALCRCCR